jgi:hypothetical protein
VAPSAAEGGVREVQMLIAGDFDAVRSGRLTRDPRPVVGAAFARSALILDARAQCAGPVLEMPHRRSASRS